MYTNISFFMILFKTSISRVNSFIQFSVIYFLFNFFFILVRIYFKVFIYFRFFPKFFTIARDCKMSIFVHISLWICVQILLSLIPRKEIPWSTLLCHKDLSICYLLRALQFTWHVLIFNQSKIKFLCCVSQGSSFVQHGK